MMSNVFLLSLGITAGVKKMSVLNIRDNFVLSLTQKYEKLGKNWSYCTRNRAATNAY